MTGLQSLIGRSYGPSRVAVTADKVGEFVAATADDQDRWARHAPPGWAASLLFEAAPLLFADPDVRPYTAAVIHSDQHFTWLGGIEVGDPLDILGTVAAVRSRSSMHLVTFEMEAAAGGRGLVRSRSTFVMAEAGGREGGSDPEAEPPATERAGNSSLGPVPVPPVGEALPVLQRSASRADLVRYAGATRDFNPIHWDHDAAAGAGLPGVVVHGLLMGAWAAQAAGRVAREGPFPLEELRLRFRKPLRPAVPAEVACTVKAVEPGVARLGVAVTSGGVDLVTGEAVVRTDGTP